MRISKTGTKQSWAIFWCDECKSEVVKRLDNGVRDKSCGCNNNKGKNNPSYKHGETNIKLYYVWDSMKNRCLNSNSQAYKDYGGRGITICPEWTNDYTKFRDWALNNGYAEGLQINRIINDGNYEPSNCNFVTAKDNSRSRRGQKIKSMEQANEIRTLYVTGDYTQKELAEMYNVSYQIIFKIIKNEIWG